MTDSRTFWIPTPLATPRLDIGFRRGMRPRGSDATGAGTTPLYPASAPGNSFLSPEFDIGAGIVVDLGRSRVIGEVALWTREAVPADIVSQAPLVISASEDGVRWREVARSGRPFAPDGACNAWQVTFPSGCEAAFQFDSNGDFGPPPTGAS